MWGLEEKDKSSANANNQLKGSSKLKIPDKTFNNPLISKDLFANENRRLIEEKSEFVIKPIPVEMSLDNIEPVPAPQMKLPKSKEINSQNSSVILKENIEKSSQSNRLPIVIPKANIENEINYTRSNLAPNSEPSQEEFRLRDINYMHRNVLLSTKRTIRDLINSSISQIKALSDLQNECMGIVQSSSSIDNEIIAKLNYFKSTINRNINKSPKKKSDNPRENWRVQDETQKQNNPPSLSKAEKWPFIEESKIDPEPPEFVIPWRDLALKLNSRSISLYDPLINKKINKFKWEEKIEGSAILFTEHNSILHVGGNGNMHEEIDIATGEKRNLPDLPQKFQFHCMSFINGCAAVIGGFNTELSSSNQVFILKNEQWEEFDSLIVRRHNASSINVNNTVYVFGGTSTKNGIVKSIELWNTKWKLLNILQPISKPNVGLCLYGDEIIIFGGKSEWRDAGSRDVWKFNYKTNRVNKLAPLYFDFFAKSGNECVLSGNIVYLLKKNEFHEYSLLENI